jgi:GntR family transcriptional regulator
LPSETELQAEHRCSRGTVRSALKELISLGLIVSEPGRGYVVRRRLQLTWRASDAERNDATLTPSDAWSRSVHEQGLIPSETIRSEITRADEIVARWLAVDVATPVSARRRLRLVNGEPFSTADSFYPRSIVKGTAIEDPDDIVPGVYAIFEKMGRPWASTVDTWSARPPTRDEATILAVPKGTVIYEIVRVSRDAAAVPVRLTHFVLPADRHIIQWVHGEVGP